MKVGPLDRVNPNGPCRVIEILAVDCEVNRTTLRDELTLAT
jgi:hypothetical protein